MGHQVIRRINTSEIRKSFQVQSLCCNSPWQIPLCPHDPWFRWIPGFNVRWIFRGSCPHPARASGSSRGDCPKHLHHRDCREFAVQQRRRPLPRTLLAHSGVDWVEAVGHWSRIINTIKLSNFKSYSYCALFSLYFYDSLRHDHFCLQHKQKLYQSSSSQNYHLIDLPCFSFPSAIQ